jgi:hypothetical protein
MSHRAVPAMIMQPMFPEGDLKVATWTTLVPDVLGPGLPRTLPCVPLVVLEPTPAAPALPPVLVEPVAGLPAPVAVAEPAGPPAAVAVAEPAGPPAAVAVAEPAGLDFVTDFVSAVDALVPAVPPLLVEAVPCRDVAAA